MPRTPETGDRPELGSPEIDGRGPLELGPCIHEYPGKRRIFRATLADGRAVVAKFYLGRFAQWHEWRRGVRGARRLEAAGVPAPAVHYAGYCPQYRAWLLVLDHIEADEPWPPPSGDPGPKAHQRLIRTLAEHHRAGILQNDLNWLNFIPRGGQLFAIDGDRVQRRRTPLGRRTAMRHLQRLYASKTRIPEARIEEGYRQYHRERGWEPDDAGLARFLQALRRARVGHARRVAGRAARGWKHYPRFRQGALKGIRDRRALSHEQAVRMAASLYDTGELPEDLPVPEGRSWQAWRIATPWDTVPGLLRPAMTRMTARRAWSHALTLRRLGLPVPRPLAMVSADHGLIWMLWETDPAVRGLDAPDASGAMRPGPEPAAALWTALRDYGIRFRGRDARALGTDGRALWILDPLPLSFGRPGAARLLRAAQADREWLIRISTRG